MAHLKIQQRGESDAVSVDSLIQSLTMAHT
jgi:hypothetical protein